MIPLNYSKRVTSLIDDSNVPGGCLGVFEIEHAVPHAQVDQFFSCLENSLLDHLRKGRINNGICRLTGSEAMNIG